MISSDVDWGSVSLVPSYPKHGSKRGEALTLGMPPCHSIVITTNTGGLWHPACSAAAFLVLQRKPDCLVAIFIWLI